MSETLCYEIYLKFEHNGKAGRIGLPVELKPRFKTLDPNAPSSEFISSLINDSIIRASIESIVESGSVFPGNPRAEQLKKTIREVLEGDHYTIEVEPINCIFDNIFGDPTNGDKPYPSVDNTPPPATNQPNTDPANADNKCYVATFTISTINGTEKEFTSNTKINVSLQSSANPLPDPISTDNPTINSIKTYVGAIDQKVADSIAIPAGHSIWGVSWNGEFWKLKGGNGACADQDDPDPAPAVDDPETPDEDESEPLTSIFIRRPDTNIYGKVLNEDEDEASYDLDLLNAIIYDYMSLEKKIAEISSSTKKSFLRPSVAEIPSGNGNNPQQQDFYDAYLNKLNLTPNQGKSLDIFTWKILDRWRDPDFTTLRVEYRRNLGNSSIVPQEIIDQIPDTITATFSLDFTIEVTASIVFLGVYMAPNIGGPEWTVRVNYPDESGDVENEYTIEKLVFVPEPPPGANKKGEDFDAAENIVKEDWELGYQDWLPKNNNSATVLKTITFTTNLTSDPFTVILNKQSQKIVKYRHGNYLVVSYSKNVVGSINEQLQLIANNIDALSKIQQAFEKKYFLDPEKDGPVWEKIVDGFRGILLKKAQKNTPKDKHRCAKVIYQDQDGYLGLNTDIKIRFID